MKVVKESVAPDSLVELVPFFKVFCHSTRAQIIDFLLSGERCVCEMTGPLDQSQPLVSHHLALLRDAGIVRMRSEGARTYYSIDWERFDGELKGFLDYVERQRSAPRPADETRSACAAAAKAVARRDGS
jgi:ArsR family transcriptional regulator, arsenate/arsenite/antimonite-responsive transcriptional repressor